MRWPNVYGYSPCLLKKLPEQLGFHRYAVKTHPHGFVPEPLPTKIPGSAYATRVTIFGDSDSNRVTLRKMVTLLDPSHVFNRMSWLDSESQSMTRVRVILTKSLSPWWTNPVGLYTKKWAFSASMMIKIGVNFLFCLSSRATLHFKDQVSPTCTR